MVMFGAREKLKAELDELSDEQIESLLYYVQSMQPGRFIDKSANGREALVGFISGPTDVAEHTEEILWAEFGLRRPDDER